MKTFVQIAIPALLTFTLLACSQKPKPAAENPATSIPIVLEGKHVDVSSLYKRNKENLIESLYQELISKSTELQALDAEIKSIAKLQQKATDSFSLFNDKNRSYYESATLNVNNIRDSVFRKKVQSLVDESLKAYKAKTQSHQYLDSLLTRKSASINDLYILMKVVKTLPAMHNFQQERLPGTTSAELLNKQFDSLLIRLDSITKLPK